MSLDMDSPDENISLQRFLWKQVYGGEYPLYVLVYNPTKLDYWLPEGFLSGGQDSSPGVLGVMPFPLLIK